MPEITKASLGPQTAIPISKHMVSTSLCLVWYCYHLLQVLIVDKNTEAKLYGLHCVYRVVTTCLHAVLHCPSYGYKYDSGGSTGTGNMISTNYLSLALS